MSLVSRKQLILAKRETTYNVDPNPLGADAVLVTDVDFTPLQADVLDRKYVRPFFGASQKITAGSRVALEFTVELAAAGAAGTVPQWGSLLRGCAMAETITPADPGPGKVEYTPVSDSPESLTFYVNLISAVTWVWR